MKPIFVAGNWKSNKTIADALAWVQQYKTIAKSTPETVTAVICAPYISLSPLKQELDAINIGLRLGAQDVSPYAAGAYTGEVNADMVKEVADWVIIGHSERRTLLGETDELLALKVTEAKKAGLHIIYCVPNEMVKVPEGVDVVAYEPVWAIGTGKSDTPDNANGVISKIKAMTGAAKVIYGGSVTAENVVSFIMQESIDGVLPGGASLDPVKFSALLQAIPV